MNVDDYILSLASSLRGDQFYFYPDPDIRKQRVLQLAREFGYGLRDFPIKEVEKALSWSYGRMVVANCFDQTGVPISNKEWVREIKSVLADR